MGGVAVAMAAEEALIRDLSVEFAPHGVRVAGVRTQGMPDSGTIEEVFGIHAKAHGVTREQFQHMVAERTHRKRCQLFRKWPRSWRSSPYPPEIPNHYYGDPRS